MKLRYLKTAFVLIATSLLFACSEFDDVEVRVNLKSGGTPVANAEVIIDGTVKGVTDASGHFMTVLQQKENTAFEVSVKKDENGVRLENWIQLTSYNDQTDDEFEYNLDLKSIPYVFISVKDGEEPVIDATLRNGKDILGVTDKRGNIYFDLNTTDKKNYTISMSKLGYGTWKANKALAPGDKVDVMLDRLMMVNVQVNTESYGDSVPVNGVDVFLGNQKIGTTNAKGVVRYSQNGQRKGKGTLTLKSAKYAPGVWKTQVPLIGDVAVKRYVYPRKANPLRVGFYRFSANTDGEDIGTIPARFQAEIIKEISGQDGFTVVDTDKLVAAIKQSKISMQKLKKDGWKNTDLHKLVDTIVFGSVSKNIKGAFIVEANFHNYEGGVAAREIALAKSSGRLDRAARELVINLKEHYPFEGLVYEQEGESYTINLGSSQFPVNRKDEFAVYNPVTSKSGKIEKYKEVGTLKINRTHNDNSSAEVNTLVKKGTKVDIGARVVRRPDREGDGKEFVTVAAKGMVDGQVKPLSGVNIYLDQKWVATTDQRGKARVNLRLKKEYDLSLYRQGYSQVDKEDFEVKDNAALVEFDLESYVSKLTVASNPAGAVIFLDDEKIGTTPMENKTVPTGFHSLKISAGGEYRDFEEVIEFTNEPKDFSGEKTVTLFTDFLKKAEKAESSENLDQAMAFYSQVNEAHPDYAEARHRLAQLFLDHKNDPTSSVAEFEKIMEVPEVKELVYKQYSVAYTNMGHAYHEKANQVINQDKQVAAQLLAKSVKSLETAQKNSRFFPNASYDVAVHDTYFYLAMSYHKLYQLSQNPNLLNKAKLAWRDYLDFFPESLANVEQYSEAKNSASQFLEQLRGDS